MGGWAKPLQTLSQGLVLTLRFRLALSLTINDTKTSFNDLEHFNSDLTSDISDVSMRVINNSEQITKVQDMAYEYSEIIQSNVKKITEVDSSLEQTSQNLGEVSSAVTKVGRALNGNYSNPRWCSPIISPGPDHKLSLSGSRCWEAQESGSPASPMSLLGGRTIIREATSRKGVLR